MYVRKIMVCNVTTFSYNRGPSGGALYLGNIGSLKDRCVSDTCDEKIPVDFFGFSIKTPVSPLEPLGGMLWEWFTKTRGQNIQKRTIPTHAKISDEIRPYGDTARHFLGFSLRMPVSHQETLESP